MSKKTEQQGDATAVARSTALKADETQVVHVIDDIPVTIDGRGLFRAKVLDTELQAESLEKMEEKVKRSVAGARRRKRKGAAPPALIVAGGQYRVPGYRGKGFFTGFHGQNGDAMYKDADGTSHRASVIHVFSPKDSVQKARFDEVCSMLAEEQELEHRLSDLRQLRRKLEAAQQRLMFGPEGKARIYGDVAAATEEWERVCTNVFGVDMNDDGGE